MRPSKRFLTKAYRRHFQSHFQPPGRRTICVDNFDPKKSTNAFSYFTQIIYFAFLRRIQKEKRQLDIKNKIMEKSGYDVAFDVDKGVLTGYDSDYNYIKESLYTKVKNK